MLILGSRLIRLIPLVEPPTNQVEIERLAIYHLMSYRFPTEAEEKVVRDLWMSIVEGQNALWDGIGEDKKECIRGEISKGFRADTKLSSYTSRGYVSAERISASRFGTSPLATAFSPARGTFSEVFQVLSFCSNR